MQIWRPTFLYTLTFLLPHGCSAPGDREAGNLCQAVQLRAIPAPAAGDNEASPPPQVLKSLACEKFTLKRSIMLLFCWGLSCLTLRVSAKISTWHAHGNSTWGGRKASQPCAVDLYLTASSSSFLNLFLLLFFFPWSFDQGNDGITYLGELFWVCKWFGVKSITLLSVCSLFWGVENFSSVNAYEILWKNRSGINKKLQYLSKSSFAVWLAQKLPGAGG